MCQYKLKYYWMIFDTNLEYVFLKDFDKYVIEKIVKSSGNVYNILGWESSFECKIVILSQ